MNQKTARGTPLRKGYSYDELPFGYVLIFADMPLSFHKKLNNVRAAPIVHARLGVDAVRECITCQDQFYSDGVHNRMCDECRNQPGEMFN